MKNDFDEILLSKLMCFSLLLCTIFMFFVCILLIWLEVQIVWISYFISYHQSSQQSMSFFHFQQSWIVTTVLVCQSDHCNKITLVSSLRVLMKLSTCILITVKNDQTNMIKQCESWKAFLKLVMKLYEAMLIRLIRTIRLTWSSIFENSLDQTVFFID